MTIRKPEYYDEFVCTANKCPFTCCREWKIEVDDETKNGRNYKHQRVYIQFERI